MLDCNCDRHPTAHKHPWLPQIDNDTQRTVKHNHSLHPLVQMHPLYWRELMMKHSNEQLEDPNYARKQIMPPEHATEELARRQAYWNWFATQPGQDQQTAAVARTLAGDAPPLNWEKPN
jgi:hypothetical protein